MIDDVQGLLLLAAIERCGSLNQAASELRISQSTASRRLAALEQTLEWSVSEIQTTLDRLTGRIAERAAELGLGVPRGYEIFS